LWWFPSLDVVVVHGTSENVRRGAHHIAVVAADRIRVIVLAFKAGFEIVAVGIFFGSEMLRFKLMGTVTSKDSAMSAGIFAILLGFSFFAILLLILRFLDKLAGNVVSFVSVCVVGVVHAIPEATGSGSAGDGAKEG